MENSEEGEKAKAETDHFGKGKQIVQTRPMAD